MSDTINQLIILGNGFDLECGLHSSFSDYYGTRQNNLEEWLKAESNGQESHNISVWDFIFAKEHENNPSWTDVESTIADWICKLHGPKDLSQSQQDWLHKFINDNAKTLSEDDYNNWREKLDNSEELSLPSLQAQCFLSKSENRYLSLDDFLFLQLKKLEDGFEQYIQQEAQNTTYRSNTEKLFHLISRYDENSKTMYSDSNMLLNNVLSFNYTRIQPSATISNTELGVWRNVHGTIGNHNIIFGIDSTQYPNYINNASVNQFTKTFRVLQLESQRRDSDIFQSSKNGHPFHSIKFYGHGLGKADYSYFKSIFDYVELYSSQVQLLFFYPSDRPIERNHLFLRVSDLLNTYGNTMIDQKRGQNLLHKLILENRLHIVELDTRALKNSKGNNTKSLSYRDEIVSAAFEKFQIKFNKEKN